MDYSLNEDKICFNRDKRYISNYVVTGSLVITDSPSATEPVSLSEAKAYMHIGFDDDNDLITSLITGAREWVEKLTGTSLISRSVTCEVQVANNMELPFGPVVGDVTTTVVEGDSLYNISTGQFKSIKGYGRYNVNYMAGYSTVPEMLKLAIKARVLDTYENRGEADKENHSLIARTYLRPFKRVRLWL